MKELLKFNANSQWQLETLEKSDMPSGTKKQRDSHEKTVNYMGTPKKQTMVMNEHPSHWSISVHEDDQAQPVKVHTGSEKHIRKKWSELKGMQKQDPGPPPSDDFAVADPIPMA